MTGDIGILATMDLMSPVVVSGIAGMGQAYEGKMSVAFGGIKFEAAICSGVVQVELRMDGSSTRGFQKV